MNQNGTARSVVVCDTQPLAIEGIRALLAESHTLRFAGAMTNLAGGMELIRAMRPAVSILDRAFGSGPVSQALNWTRNNRGTLAIVWGSGISNAEAIRMLQAGARGVLRKTAGTDQILQCINAVIAGHTWMEETILQDADRAAGISKSNLTAREQQVAELVEKGLKNRDIAQTLGIQTGTVKIHLKHIFEKTGCRGRYGLALNGLREKGFLQLVS